MYLVFCMYVSVSDNHSSIIIYLELVISLFDFLEHLYNDQNITVSSFKLVHNQTIVEFMKQCNLPNN